MEKCWCLHERRQHGGSGTQRTAISVPTFFSLLPQAISPVHDIGTCMLLQSGDLRIHSLIPIILSDLKMVRGLESSQTVGDGGRKDRIDILDLHFES